MLIFIVKLASQKLKNNPQKFHINYKNKHLKWQCGLAKNNLLFQKPLKFLAVFTGPWGQFNANQA